MRLLVILLLLMQLGVTRADVLNINRDWKFQRLPSKIEKGKINNQGTAWSSQFNIVHENSSSKLALDEKVVNEELQALASRTWESINLPHTAFVENLVVLHQWQGICYYKRNLPIANDLKGKEIWLEFGAAMHLADVWVNGTHVMQNAGGYLPFVADIAQYLRYGEDNEILVRLDNRDNPLIPPGKPINTLDFCYYSGLYRDVNLIVKPKQHITHPIKADKVAGGGVFVRYPLVSKEKAEVLIDCEIANTASIATQVELKHTLYKINGLFGKGKKGKAVAKKVQSLQLAQNEDLSSRITLSVEEPALWSPAQPNLYLLETEVVKDGKVIDAETTRLGIRRIEMCIDKGFVINGEPMRLVGSNRHMDYPYVGNALSKEAQYRDIYHIRTNGFNIVRLGHYPQDPSVLEACDELGLLAIEPIPGWQFFNKDAVFIENTYKDLRNMIRRDRNHASVVMWETTLNESWPPNSWKNEAVKIAHEEYPGDQCFTAGDSYGYDGFDVCYNDWQEGFKRPNKTKKPSFIREYYDYEFGGHYSTTRITRGEGEKALLQNLWNAQWSHNRYRKMYPNTMGDAVWSMYDYNRGCCDNICHSGLADIFRLHKYSLDFFRTQIAQGELSPLGETPYEVFIASRWDAESALQDTLVVLGNVEEIELICNGKSIARQSCDTGSTTEYEGRSNAGNIDQLNFPPFTFSGIDWQEGTLEAVGYVKGKRVAQTKVSTPQAVEKIAISYFEAGKPAAREDVLIVYVSLIDKRGNLVPMNGETIHLTVEGGKIQGPKSYKTEAGIASFVVNTADHKRLKLQARLSKEIQSKLNLKLQ